MNSKASPKKSKPNLIVSEGRTWRVEYDRIDKTFLAAETRVQSPRGQAGKEARTGQARREALDLHLPILWNATLDS